MSDYYLSTNFGDIVITSYLTDNFTWLALHSADPTVAGSTADEFAGYDYARQPITWAAAASKTTSNTAPIAFHNMGAGTATWFGIWDALTASNLIFAVMLPTPIVIASSGSLVLATGDLAITL